MKKLCKVEIAHFIAKEALEAGEERAAECFKVAKGDYDLAYKLYHSACELFLDVRP